MVYLSNVPSGGHTIFLQSGVSVKPEAGKALFWYNHDAVAENDSRIFHLGCPVIFGNKWIANKWIKWEAQYKHYPCAVEKQDYNILNFDPTILRRPLQSKSYLAPKASELVQKYNEELEKH